MLKLLYLILTITLIAFKAMGVVVVGWGWVLAPIWIPLLLALVICIFAFSWICKKLKI